MPDKAKAPTLDETLQKHWTQAPLQTTDELPPDTASLSTSAQFAEQVKALAPKWVLLPVPPANREQAKRAVAALRRRGLEAAMRPAQDRPKQWAVWARARANDANGQD